MSLRHSCRSELTRQGISLPQDRYSYGRRLLGLQFSARTPPLNLPAPGRRQPLYVVFTTQQRSVFLLNSRYSLVCDPDQRLPFNQACLSQSYACNLPSSFNIVLSSASVYSTNLPVSVQGTVNSLCSYFLCLVHYPYNPISKNNLPKPSLTLGAGILTSFPSTTPFSLALGTGSPCADYLYAGTLRFSARVFLTLFFVTHVNIRTSDISRTPHSIPSQTYGTLRYQSRLLSIPQLRCVVLAPLHLRRKTSYLDQ